MLKAPTHKQRSLRLGTHRLHNTCWIVCLDIGTNTLLLMKTFYLHYKVKSKASGESAGDQGSFFEESGEHHILHP